MSVARSVQRAHHASAHCGSACSLQLFSAAECTHLVAKRLCGVVRATINQLVVQDAGVVVRVCVQLECAYAVPISMVAGCEGHSCLSATPTAVMAKCSSVRRMAVVTVRCEVRGSAGEQAGACEEGTCEF